MRSVREIPVFENIPVLVRTALNVPLAHNSVTNDYRLRRAIPTIRYLAKRRAKIILISHLGEQGTETLEPVAKALSALVSGVSFCKESTGPVARAAVRALAPGQVLVLENVRRHKGERTNDPLFAKELSLLGDVFVQDSFDTCHRVHASIVGVPKFLPSYGGLLLEEEVRELSRALSPKHPALAVIGGAKFSTKEGVLTSLLSAYDNVFVGGALADDFLKADGQEVGRSLISDADESHIKKLLRNRKLVLPLDMLVVPHEYARDDDARKRARVAKKGDVRAHEAILDGGPETSTLLETYANQANTILWNGPLGNYENGFSDATDAFAQTVAKSPAHTIVGGGDTIAAIEKLGLLPSFSFVSIGGGAMLEFLAHGTLPGIEALASHISA